MGLSPSGQFQPILELTCSQQTRPKIKDQKSFDKNRTSHPGVAKTQNPQAQISPRKNRVNKMKQKIQDLLSQNSSVDSKQSKRQAKTYKVSALSTLDKSRPSKSTIQSQPARQTRSKRKSPSRESPKISTERQKILNLKLTVQQGMKDTNSSRQQAISFTSRSMSRKYPAPIKISDNTTGDDSSSYNLQDRLTSLFAQKPVNQKIEFLRMNIGLVNYEVNHLLRQIVPTTTHKRMLSLKELEALKSQSRKPKSRKYTSRATNEDNRTQMTSGPSEQTVAQVTTHHDDTYSSEDTDEEQDNPFLREQQQRASRTMTLPQGTHFNLKPHYPTQVELLPDKIIFCQYNISEVLDFQQYTVRGRGGQTTLRLPIKFIIKEVAESDDCKFNNKENVDIKVCLSMNQQFPTQSSVQSYLQEKRILRLTQKLSKAQMEEQKLEIRDRIFKFNNLKKIEAKKCKKKKRFEESFSSEDEAEDGLVIGPFGNHFNRPYQKFQNVIYISILLQRSLKSKGKEDEDAFMSPQNIDIRKIEIKPIFTEKIQLIKNTESDMSDSEQPQTSYITKLKEELRRMNEDLEFHRQKTFEDYCIELLNKFERQERHKEQASFKKKKKYIQDNKDLFITDLKDFSMLEGSVTSQQVYLSKDLVIRKARERRDQLLQEQREAALRYQRRWDEYRIKKEEMFKVYKALLLRNKKVKEWLSLLRIRIMIPKLWDIYQHFRFQYRRHFAKLFLALKMKIHFHYIHCRNYGKKLEQRHRNHIRRSITFLAGFKNYQLNLNLDAHNRVFSLLFQWKTREHLIFKFRKFQDSLHQVQAFCKEYIPIHRKRKMFVWDFVKQEVDRWLFFLETKKKFLKMHGGGKKTVVGGFSLDRLNKQIKYLTRVCDAEKRIELFGGVDAPSVQTSRDRYSFLHNLDYQCGQYRSYLLVMNLIKFNQARIKNAEAQLHLLRQLSEILCGEISIRSSYGGVRFGQTQPLKTPKGFSLVDIVKQSTKFVVRQLELNKIEQDRLKFQIEKNQEVIKDLRLEKENENEEINYRVNQFIQTAQEYNAEISAPRRVRDEPKVRFEISPEQTITQPLKYPKFEIQGAREESYKGDSVISSESYSKSESESNDAKTVHRKQPTQIERFQISLKQQQKSKEYYIRSENSSNSSTIMSEDSEIEEKQQNARFDFINYLDIQEKNLKNKIRQNGLLECKLRNLFSKVNDRIYQNILRIDNAQKRIKELMNEQYTLRFSLFEHKHHRKLQMNELAFAEYVRQLPSVYLRNATFTMKSNQIKSRRESYWLNKLGKKEELSSRGSNSSQQSQVQQPKTGAQLAIPNSSSDSLRRKSDHQFKPRRYSITRTPKKSSKSQIHHEPKQFIQKLHKQSKFAHPSPSMSPKAGKSKRKIVISKLSSLFEPNQRSNLQELELSEISSNAEDEDRKQNNELKPPSRIVTDLATAPGKSGTNLTQFSLQKQETRDLGSLQNTLLNIQESGVRSKENNRKRRLVATRTLSEIESVSLNEENYLQLLQDAFMSLKMDTGYIFEQSAHQENELLGIIQTLSHQNSPFQLTSLKKRDEVNVQVYKILQGQNIAQLGQKLRQLSDTFSSFKRKKKFIAPAFKVNLSEIHCLIINAAVEK